MAEVTGEFIWTRRDPMDGDPFWEARLGHLNLTVRVAAEFVWEWSIDLDDDERSLAEDDVARGSAWALTSDEEYDCPEWDYQGVERAQRRCEAVGRALATALAVEADGG